MSQHKNRAEKRAEQKDPINFTCGICKQVHKYEGSYECSQQSEQPPEDI